MTSHLLATSAVLRFAGAVVLLGLASMSAPAWAFDQGWRSCATEGGVCQVTERSVVRYGVPGSWATRSVRGDVLCSNLAFGDPAPNQPKRCEIASRSFAASGSNGSGGSGGGTGDDYIFCAAEGQICTFRGGADVRFGHGDRYTTRRAYGSVRCDVTAFGDPVYGQTKHCEVPRSAALAGGAGSGGSWAGGSDRWRYCAGEGQPCRVEGRVQVRFGDGQRFATRTVSGEVMCDTSVFGDPSYGQRKHCEVQASGWTGGPGEGGGTSAGWRSCAQEGAFCRFDGRAQVRYGADGRYQYRDAWDGVSCDNDAFGGDPYPNRPKRCEVLQR